jgi:hypothetical protein
VIDTWSGRIGRDGLPAGIHELRNALHDDLHDTQRVVAVARVTTFDPNGNVVGQGVALATAERVQVEPISDRP